MAMGKPTWPAFGAAWSGSEIPRPGVGPRDLLAPHRSPLEIWMAMVKQTLLPTSPLLVSGCSIHRQERGQTLAPILLRRLRLETLTAMEKPIWLVFGTTSSG